MARIAASLGMLLAQVDAAFPGRDKSNDGWIGDARHAATVSDHNPDSSGVVHALDITNDPSKGCVSEDIARTLITSRDKRIKYVISNRRIALGHGDNAWTWQPYTGSSPHDCHVHISVVAEPALADDRRPWALALAAGVATPAAKPVAIAGRHLGITATEFGGAGDENASAYGGMVDPAKPGVALPYRFTGPRATVRVFKGGKSVDCAIVDVGPWNVDDPYWITAARPQAESGRDATGRKTNKAGIDLTPAAARAIGLDGLGLVDWEFVNPAAAPVASPPALVPQSSIWAALGAALSNLFKKG